MLSLNSLGHRQPPDNSVPERKEVDAHLNPAPQQSSIPEGGQSHSPTAGSET